jgi:hypothetical protein
MEYLVVFARVFSWSDELREIAFLRALASRASIALEYAMTACK